MRGNSFDTKMASFKPVANYDVNSRIDTTVTSAQYFILHIRNTQKIYA